MQSQVRGVEEATKKERVYFAASYILNRLQIVAAELILVLHVNVIGHHVPRHYKCIFETNRIAQDGPGSLVPGYQLRHPIQKG